MRIYVYLVLNSQVQTRSSILGNSTSAVDAPLQQAYKSTDKCSIGVDIERCHSELEHAISKEDFSKGTSVYMLPIN